MIPDGTVKVFFQMQRWVGGDVNKVTVHPDWQGTVNIDGGGDLAILELTAQAPLRLGRFQGANTAWDTHIDQYPRLKDELLPGFDLAYSATRSRATPRTTPSRRILCTIYHVLGIDPHTELRDREGRPCPWCRAAKC